MCGGGGGSQEAIWWPVSGEAGQGQGLWVGEQEEGCGWRSSCCVCVRGGGYCTDTISVYALILFSPNEFL